MKTTRYFPRSQTVFINEQSQSWSPVNATLQQYEETRIWSENWSNLDDFVVSNGMFKC
jgi:hypothetical protein